MNGLDLFSGIGGIALALDPWVPTPTASQYGSSQNGINSSRPSGGTLSLAARDARRSLWSTTSNVTSTTTAPAPREIWPTPTVADSRASARSTTATGISHAGESLTDALRSHTGIGKALLSPRFVGWMMGFPDGWSDLNPSVTPSFPLARAKPSNFSAASDDIDNDDQLGLWKNENNN